MQQRSLSIRVTQNTNYTTANTWANIANGAVASFVITAPEDGNYDIFATVSCYQDTAGDTTAVRLAVNGNWIEGCMVENYAGAGVVSVTPTTLLGVDISLKAGDIVSVQAEYVAGGATVVRTSATAQGVLKIIKRGL